MAQTPIYLATAQTVEPTVIRRSGNYPPSMWDYNFLESLKSDYKGEIYKRRANKLKENVGGLLEEEVGQLASLELVDDIGRLGLGYMFEKEIKSALKKVSLVKNNDNQVTEGLKFVALRFRLLRQHGYEVSPDIFRSFKDQNGSFMDSLREDPTGLLSLFEASYFALEGETILDEGRDFASERLKVVKGNISQDFAKMVSHALELPLHWRLQRLEARWYIDIYERKEGMNPSLLELSKLDYNMVQAIYQEDVKDSLRWWRKLGLAENSTFARDRILESFIWSMGINWEPEFQWSRRAVTKVTQLVTTVDDLYDVYGTLDELEIFTDVIQRWDINEIDRLPQYMKICFLAVYNTANETASEVLKKHGVDAIPYLKKTWVDLCQAYMVEARWYHKGYIPTLEEYLDNAWTSVGAKQLLVTSYFCVTKEITPEALDSIQNNCDLLYHCGVTGRLWDDLATSKEELERGDVPKSIQCYMHHTGVSEAAAREHVKRLILKSWKKFNKACGSSLFFPQAFVDSVTNLLRITQFYYQYRDGFGFGSLNHLTNDRIRSLVFEPIPL